MGLAHQQLLDLPDEEVALAEGFGQIEQTLLSANGDGLEVGLAEGDLGPVGVAKAELRRAIREVRGDDEVEASRHGG